MKRLLLTALTIALIATGASAVMAAVGDDRAPVDPAGTTTTTTEDISGPCDEAEHADDPRCGSDGRAEDDARDDDGPNHDAGDDNGTDAGDDDGPGDISGPCDEAEHANDPRCTGAATDDSSGDEARVDNSGPGSLNSGPGSINSGRDDDADDDHSGPGRGDDDDDADDDHGGDDVRDDDVDDENDDDERSGSNSGRG